MNYRRGGDPAVEASARHAEQVAALNAVIEAKERLIAELRQQITNLERNQRLILQSHGPV